jgi:uncharacterized protein YwqG
MRSNAMLTFFVVMIACLVGFAILRELVLPRFKSSTPREAPSRDPGPPRRAQTLDDLPSDLARFKDQFAATQMSFIEITPIRASETRLWESKYRGVPYLPKNAEYPKNASGRPMPLLAQINFREAPKLDGYPDSGILQFFISDQLQRDHVWGIRFPEPYSPEAFLKLNTTQDYFHVRYYADVTENESELITSFSFLPRFDHLPVEGEYRLTFNLSTEYAAPSDIRFERTFGKNMPAAVYDFFDASGNKIGGYASFVQGDPREMVPPGEDWLLLLQIDEAPNANIMWGDGGVGNFFITAEALQRRDFSRVLYYWDNH